MSLHKKASNQVGPIIRLRIALPQHRRINQNRTKQEGDDGNLIEGSETVYGICLDSLWVLEGQKLEESVILSIGVSTVNEENIESFIRFLFSSEQSK